MGKSDSIVLGGGCFWCLEAAYQQLDGVTEVLPGYSGGHAENATYQAVSTGGTGHVEVVKVSYNPEIVALENLMAIFWVLHDPTSLNRQGADVGSQYASAVFYTSDTQKEAVIASRNDAQAQLKQPIVTRIELLEAFYEAEDYHRNYFENNPGAAYCQVVIEPKLSKLRQHFSPLLKH